MKFILLIGVLLTVGAFTNQPLDERTAQDILPQSHDMVWKKIAACTVRLDPKKFMYTIKFTPEVKAMEGKHFTVSGFMLPVEATEKFTHFLFSKRTPTCPFCMPGEPNEIIEVFMKKPLSWDEGLVTLEGVMHFTNNPETGLFFQMKEGSMVGVSN